MKLPFNPVPLSEIGKKAIAGLESFGEALDLPIKLKETAEFSLNHLTQTIAACDDESAFSELSIVPALGRANDLGAKSLTLARDLLVGENSDIWDSVWVDAGLSSSSKAKRIPSSMRNRLALLKSLSTFLTKNAAWEDESAGLTAAIFTQRAQSLGDALRQADDHNRVRSRAITTRTVAAAQLRESLNDIVAKLEEILDGDDPRWAGFGFDNWPSGKTPSSDSKPRRLPVPSHKLTDNGAEVAAMKMWIYAQRLATESLTQAKRALARVAQSEETTRQLRLQAEGAIALSEQLQDKANELAPPGLTTTADAIPPRTIQSEALSLAN